MWQYIYKLKKPFANVGGWVEYWGRNFFDPTLTFLLLLLLPCEFILRVSLLAVDTTDSGEIRLNPSVCPPRPLRWSESEVTRLIITKKQTSFFHWPTHPSSIKKGHFLGYENMKSFFFNAMLWMLDTIWYFIKCIFGGDWVMYLVGWGGWWAQWSVYGACHPRYFTPISHIALMCTTNNQVCKIYKLKQTIFVWWRQGIWLWGKLGK